MGADWTLLRLPSIQAETALPLRTGTVWNFGHQMDSRAWLLSSLTGGQPIVPCPSGRAKETIWLEQLAIASLFGGSKVAKNGQSAIMNRSPMSHSIQWTGVSLRQQAEGLPTSGRLTSG